MQLIMSYECLTNQCKIRLPHVVSIDFWQYKVEVEVENTEIYEGIRNCLKTQNIKAYYIEELFH